MAICAMKDLELEAAYQRMADKAMIKAKEAKRVADELQAKIEDQANGIIQPRRYRVNVQRIHVCTPRQLQKKKEYYRKNREEILAKHRVYYAANRDELRAYHREFWRLVAGPRRAAERNLLRLSTIDDIK